ncbi:DUF4350 domain-containing protein [Chitinophaga costaii]|uniref:DUF4350 domain-containing protein n=1 Tax=Chitinophaga costaii TaxID=1335309 RepID=UPI001F0C6EA8|nr:DUF4350 domain-containing protein [Chitinophaga costaii]
MKKILYLLIASLYAATASAQTVMVDAYFNHELRTPPGGGEKVPFHYRWEDTTNTGFSIWGQIFRQQGATLQTLEVAPSAATLKANVYIIADPDTQKETAHPNLIESHQIAAIQKWVKAGGILVLMANDSANAELPHLNHLAAVFGLHFNDDLQNHVVDDAHFEDGAIYPQNDPIFTTAQKIFLKDVASISLKGPARPSLKAKNGAVIAATIKYGKGKVFAVGDPWLYNEYVNGRLPAAYQNDKAAADLARWLLAQIPGKIKYKTTCCRMGRG